jgi:hypothetical protein
VGGWKRQPNFARVIISRRMRWAGIVARMGEKCMRYSGWKTWRDHLEDLGVDGKILEWLLGDWGGKMWDGFTWLRIGTSGGLL